MLPDSNKFRPKPFYFLTDVSDTALSEKAVNTAVDSLAESGFGGCVLFNKPPGGFSREEFLGPAWFRCVRRFAEAARAKGLSIWINDGFDFPPGDAAGRIEAVAPELQQRYLSLDESGEVIERVADWGFPAFEEPRSAELFVEFVYEPHRRELGDLFGNGIVGFFSDADNRRVAYGRFAAMKNRHYFPWSRQFSKRFVERFGYPVENRLKEILMGVDSTASYHYWLLAGELYQNWFAANYNWCVAHGLEYTFHTSDMGLLHWDYYPRSSTFTEGDYFHQARFATWPGTDHELTYLDSSYGCRAETLVVPWAFWGGRMPDLRGGEHYRRVRGDTRAKLAGSAAYLYHRPGAMCEMFAATNWSCSPAVLRDIAAWQIMQGINFIVPHAWHHRLHGETKFFAPPDFSPHNNWSKAMCSVNDYLAETCAVASEGELIAPVALLYPVGELWKNRGDANRYFVAAEALNRMPHGYVVVSPDHLVSVDRSFEYVINAGTELTAELRAEIARRGATLLEIEELDHLPPLKDCRWQGCGHPHFMRRHCEDGDILLLGNIEDDVPIQGILHWQEDEYSVVLEPGEIAWWTPCKNSFRTPKQPGREIRLPDLVPVEWDAPNRIPLYRWETLEGRACSSESENSVLEFKWQNSEAVPEPEWWLPETIVSEISELVCDGVVLNVFESGMVFDDAYRIYRLPRAGDVGCHSLRLTKKHSFSFQQSDIQYLCGEFDVRVAVSGPADGRRRQYLFELKIPEYAEIILSQRRHELRTNLSWAEQGHPFYSGGVTYSCSVEIPAEPSRCELYLPRVECIAEVKWNDCGLGLRPWSPYMWTLPSGGLGSLSVHVRNTLANQLEGYRAESGLAAGWKIRCF